MNPLLKIKYPILKAIDFSGLTFLSPVVRLCYGEEPKVQLEKISKWIIVPILAILAFIFAWFIASGKIRTNTGTLPNPAETWAAKQAISQFAEYEHLKRDAFNLTGNEREATLVAAQTRLLEVEPLLIEATKKVNEAKETHAADLQKSIDPLQTKYDALKEKNKDAAEARKAELAALSENLKPGEKRSHENLLNKVKEDIELTDYAKEEQRALKDEMDDIRNEKSKQVNQALAEQTRIAEEKQFLEKQIDQLTGDNRELKIIETEDKISTGKEELYATSGADALKLAKRIAKDEEKLDKITNTEYAMPKTIGYQVRRSILCVFTGFLIGSIIAIPIGILCGLNSTFMAAMTPFIAIFKPVSPIVWLPICLIVASYYVPSPEESPLMLWMWEDAWFIKEYDINPAFIASACTVALCSLWATLANTALGVASIDKDHMNVARVLKLGFWSRLFKIIIPSALPLIFAGLRISLGVGWMVLIAAELLSSSEGIGKFVWDQFNNGASDSLAKMMVAVFIVGFIGLVLDRIMIVFQRMVSFEGGAATI